MEMFFIPLGGPKAHEHFGRDDNSFLRSASIKQVRLAFELETLQLLLPVLLDALWVAIR
jgi:hypothetical protein